MRLTNAEIDRYGPLTGCRPACNNDITIVAGPNESGKTLYLEGVLQLLEPDVTAHMDPGPRVNQSPTGRVIVENGSGRQAVGDGTTLSDISRIEPNHLYNLFVIRDSDLALPDGSEYYTSLVEHLGDIHTTEIESIRDGLVDEGRLTPTHLNLANREYDTKDVKQTAESLAADIETYLDTVEEQDIPELERQRFTVRNERQTVEDQLATQQTAKEVAAINDAAKQLAAYRTATEQLQESTVDRDTLNELREHEQALSQANSRITEIESTFDRKQSELKTQRQALSDARERLAELTQRESDVERVESELETYRDQATDSTPGDETSYDSRLAQRRYATIAGLIGAGLAGVAGALTGSIGAILLGVVLLVIAVGAWFSHRQLTARTAEIGARKQELLQTARDAGFDVDEPTDVAPLIRDYRDELEGAKSRVRKLEAEVNQLDDRVEELEETLQDKTTEQQQLQSQLDSTLDDAGVESIGAYEERVEKLEEQETRRSKAETILTREFGEPNAESPAENITYWESELAARQSAVGESAVDADQYEEAELERLKRKQQELKSQLDEITTKLDEHHEKLDTFERRVTTLSPPPFVEATPSLQAHTIDGLRDLGADLDDLVDEIERNAGVSKKAINILDTIKEEEEQKVATLFDPDGPASTILSQLTDGRYTAVDYDPSSESLEVQTTDGQAFTPNQLSRGTRDQLYFAARLSLAKQLLGGDTGFLLLDDPFLAADSTRLRNGFETLHELSNDGWQIMYLTAKQEVQDRMADEFGCDVHEVEPLDY
jgi:exonuclease SbcC